MGRRREVVGRRAPPRSRSFSVIAALYLVFSLAVAAGAARAIHNSSLPGRPLADPPPEARYLFLFVLDGARPDYLSIAPLPHLDALMRRGTTFTNAIDGILESETPAGHTTIATGSTPARNGILGFEWAQNDNDYSIFSPDVVRSGAMEHIMESANVPTLASLYKAKYPRAKVVALSGHKYYAADPLGGPAADAIMYYQGNAQGQYVPVAIPGHVPPAPVLDAAGLTFNTTKLPIGVEDTLATKLGLRALAIMHQRLTLINEPEFDWPVGHVDGSINDPAVVRAAMRAFDRDLGMVEQALRRAGILRQTLFVITADHGMAPTYRFVPNSILSDAVKMAGAVAPTISLSTGGYVWLTDNAKAPAVAANIARTGDPGIQSVYYLTYQRGKAVYRRDTSLPLNPRTEAANQYLLRTLLNGHEPSVVAFCREGQTFANTSTNWKADHGGPEWQSQHIPLVLSGPGVRPGVTVTAAAQLDDVAPTVLRLMGVAPRRMQGRVLTEVEATAARPDQARRSSEIKQLTPVVQALLAQDRHEQTRQ